MGEGPGPRASQDIGTCSAGLFDPSCEVISIQPHSAIERCASLQCNATLALMLVFT